MQPAELLKYIENPQLLTKQSVKQLQKLVDDFPYFQSAHILLSVASKKWDASVYQQTLKKTAIVATNRSHLFNLIHKLENEEVAQRAPEEKVSDVLVQENKEELSIQELDILKVTEAAGEKVSANKVELNALQNSEKIAVVNKPLPDPNEILEKEIQNRVVNSFVEKEILKTNELHHPKSNRENSPAESFVEWLALLKKNNGQTYDQVTEQVATEKAKNKLSKSGEASRQLDGPNTIGALQHKKDEKSEDGEKSDNKSRKEKNRALMDKIIESAPGIIRSKEEQKFYTAENKAKESLIENEHLVTETLAKIYALQGSVNKAVRAYEILSLKFPQKSAYFATLIQKLKSNQ